MCVAPENSNKKANTYESPAVEFETNEYKPHDIASNITFRCKATKLMNILSSWHHVFQHSVRATCVSLHDLILLACIFAYAPCTFAQCAVVFQTIIDGTIITYIICDSILNWFTFISGLNQVRFFIRPTYTVLFIFKINNKTSTRLCLNLDVPI